MKFTGSVFALAERINSINPCTEANPLGLSIQLTKEQAEHLIVQCKEAIESINKIEAGLEEFKKKENQ